MKVQTDVTYRNLEKTDAIESLVAEKIAKLEKFCDYMSSCRVAVEKTHDRPDSGTPYRVRIDMTIPPSHELAVDRSPDVGTQYTPLETVIREAFEAARRQVVELVEKQRGEVKTHPQQEMMAIVTKLESDHGFIKSVASGREVYFHKNSVISDDFDRLEVGTGVAYADEMGTNGPQATTVQIVNKPGTRAEKTETEVEQPMGWK